ncbi:putative bifunctional diguanylate cyclase/phosphodiesterase [Acanthopleuribacter pedis]|uniref:EAL domain-containing protein n=1 Tax=Acanthopleuribacter pedis TaxID=442870 RepID=A0A8J7Q6M8_9BACT|nr:bifunctional diguanylate cyclase/phosphodiesterase [Acanthopleuribacter pedis]MBO1317704.1 EAL domain-containing protein [Acanthopleuribacter pedis]
MKPINRPPRLSMALLMALKFTFAMILISLVLLSISLYFMRQLSIQRLGSELKRIVTTASLKIDGEAHQKFRSNEDADNPAWREIRGYLSQVQQINGLEFDHLYTFHLPDQEHPGQIQFAVMLHPDPFVGAVYQIPERNQPIFQKALATGEPQKTGVYTDDHGSWLSAIAPIRDRQNHIVGLIEADYRVDGNNAAYLAALSAYILPLLGLFAIFIPLGMAVIWYLTHTVANPISTLAATALTDPEQEAAFFCGPSPWREVDQLAKALVKMRHRIQTQIAQLRSFNEALEVKVKQRTRELEQAQHELKLQTQRELAYQKTHDSLTGLANRHLFAERLAAGQMRALQNDHQLAVLVLDIDRFKHLNDNLGIAQGDTILREVGTRLEGALKRTDTVARIDGDEFAVLLSKLHSVQEAARTAERLIQAVGQPQTVGDLDIHVSLSVGIALFPDDAQVPDELTACAEKALSATKTGGGGGFTFFSKQLVPASARLLALENELRKALNTDQVCLHYQPQIDIHSGEIIGAESLMRWIHPEMGFISPGEFIPLAEETGLMVQIGKWSIRSVLRTVQDWHRRGLTPIVVAVNLSARQFAQDDLVAFMAESLAEVALGDFRIELEITESIAMGDVETTVRKLADLRAMGLMVALDDFGTGYSSLSYLKRFHLDKLKIDKSFVDHVAEEPEDSAIAKAVIEMGHALGLKVIAEGVETQTQLDYLKTLGCDEIQGYYFSKPLPEAEIVDKWLARVNSEIG